MITTCITLDQVAHYFAFFSDRHCNATPQMLPQAISSLPFQHSKVQFFCFTHGSHSSATFFIVKRPCTVDNSQDFLCGRQLLFISIKLFLNVVISLMDNILFDRHRVAPALASYTFRQWSSGGEGQRSYLRASWKHALAGLVAGTGAVLAYTLHHHKVRA